MAHQLADAKIKELSLVLKMDPDTGAEYSPRNSEAVVLALKASEKKTGIAKAIEGFTQTLKSYFAADDAAAEPAAFPVSEAGDNIDNDGDGPEDYNQIVSALCMCYSDISAAFGISDDGARSAAIVKAIDSFLDGLDDLRGDDDSEKAGARHSAADKAHIDALVAAHAKAKAAVDGMADHLSALQPAPQAAAKTAEVEVQPAQADKAEEIDMTQEELDAKIAEAVTKATEAATAAATEAFAAKAQELAQTQAVNAQAQIDAAKAEAQVEVDRAKADAVAAEQRAAAANETLKAAAGIASTQSTLSASVSAQKSGGLGERMAREMAANPISTVF